MTNRRFAVILYIRFINGGMVLDKVSEIFGTNVFNDSVMIERLPKDTYKTLKAAIKRARVSTAVLQTRSPPL